MLNHDQQDPAYILNLSTLNLAQMERTERITEAVESWLASNPGHGRQDLAKKVGVSGATITQWTSGDTKSFRPENLFKFSDVTGYAARWLAIEDGPKFNTEVPEGRKEKPSSIDPRHMEIVEGLMRLKDVDDAEEILEQLQSKLRRQERRSGKENTTHSGQSPGAKEKGRRTGAAGKGLKTS